MVYLTIHGIPESDQSAWETPIQTLGPIHSFMKEGLKISDPTTIPLLNSHRLSPRPVYKHGIKVNRPSIIKVSNASDKRRLFSDLKKLKSYNENRKEMNLSSVYVTEHLPKLFQKEWKLLLPFCKNAKSLNKKTMVITRMLKLNYRLLE